MLLTAYYFKGQDLCLNRPHLRDDLAELRAWRVDAVAVGLHSFQLKRRDGGFGMVFDEAKRAGLKVFAIPSRWGGLVAGWPSAPCMFTATHPETWMQRADGSPLFKPVSGPVSSVHHPATFDFYRDALASMFETWDIDGVIWDEIKVLHEEDHSEAAKRILGRPSAGMDQVRATAAFFGKVNAAAREMKKDAVISAFIYSYLPQAMLDACAAMGNLDYFGCDGKCWTMEERENLREEKLLFGQMERFAAAARKHGAGSLALIETQGLSPREVELTKKNLPAFLEMPLDHLLFYHHPVSAVDCTTAIAPSLARWRRKS